MSSSGKYTFPGATGAELAGRLDLPEGRPRAYALFAHCFTCSKDFVAASRISKRLVERGFGVLRFDFTGLGSSEGDFDNTSFTSNIEDLVAAANALAESHAGPCLLIGHSLGGAAVLAAANRVPSATAVATLAAPFDPGHIKRLFPDEALQQLREHGTAEVTLAGRSFTVGAKLLEDAESHRMEKTLREFDRALMVMHSPSDEEVAIENARRIYEAAPHPKSFVTLDGADHLLTDRADAEYAADVLAAWSSRYLPEIDRSEDDTPEGIVLVEESGYGRYTQSIQAGSHFWTSDEPAGVGDDTGPTPYDLLLSSLGACTSMTLRMYAERKGYPLERVSVRLRHRRTHSEDCENADGSPCSMQHIDSEIRVSGDLDDAQRERLREIAARCPVHRTITGDLGVSTTLRAV